MDSHIVAIYCLCANMLHALQHRNDPQCHLTDAEIMTVAVVAVLFFGGTYARAQAHLATTYAHYTASGILGHVLREDVAVRFTGVHGAHAPFPQALAYTVSHYINHVVTVRNSARF